MTEPSDATADNSGMFGRTQAENDDQFTGVDWGLFVGVSMIWGSSFLLIAYALEGLTPSMVTLLRVGIGALTLWGIRAIQGTDVRIAPADRGRILAVSVLWVAIPFSLFPIAQQWINSAVTGLLNGATPLLVAGVSIVLVKVVPRGLQIAGLIAGFVGVVLISLGSAADGGSQARGVALVLVATACYGLALNMAPPIQAKYGAIVTMSSVLGVATVLVTPLALVDIGDNDWQLTAVAAAVVLGAIGTGIAYWIMASLVGRVGALRASFITYLIPVVSLLLGVAIRGDEVSALALIGAPVTILGALLASRKVRGS